MKVLRLPAGWRKTGIFTLVAAGIFLALKFTLLAPPAVEVVFLTPRNLAREVYGNGTVEAKVVIPVSSKMAGRIAALYADQGDFVRAGQPVAKLEDEDYRQQVLQAQAQSNRTPASQALEEANLQKAMANLTLAESTYQRYRSLGEQGLLAQQEVEEKAAAFAVARNEVERIRAALHLVARDHQALQANLALAATRQRDMLILAPQDGVILARHLEMGATVSPGLPIFSLADTNVVWISANVDEARRDELAVGQAAAICLRSAASERKPGRVARIGLMSDRVTEEIEVNASFDSPLQSFRVGEQAEVYIRTAARAAAPSLPAGAVFAKGAQRFVWVVEDGRLRNQAVTVGIEDRSGFIEVLAGIDEQTAVALAPPELAATFKDDMRVRRRQ